MAYIAKKKPTGAHLSAWEQKQKHKMKRKLPAWFDAPIVEEAVVVDERERVRANAQLALEILENGLLRAYQERMDDQLLPADDSEPEDEDAFDLSQSSVVDVMTTEEALEIMGDVEVDKQDRKQLICDLKGALSKSFT